jgi:hypothetical protein
VKWIDPRITKQLDLESHGLSLIQPDTVRIALGENGKNIPSTAIPKKLRNPYQPIQKKMEKFGANSQNTSKSLLNF